MSQPQKIAGAYRRALGRSCLVFAIGLPTGVALVALTLWVAGGASASADSYRPLLALLVAPAFLAVLGAGAWWFVRSRGRRLDRLFEPFGMAGTQVGGVLRGWTGSWNDREVDAWFSKGPTFELFLGCHTATRGGVGRPGATGRRLAAAIFDREPLEPVPGEAEGLTVYAEDPEWMRSFLAAPDCKEALDELLTETDRVSPMLAVGPEALQYVRRFERLDRITDASVRGWLEALERLARCAETVGPSASGATPSRLETWARKERGRSWLPKFFGCLLVGTVLVFAGLFLLFYFAHYR